MLLWNLEPYFVPLLLWWLLKWRNWWREVVRRKFGPTRFSKDYVSFITNPNPQSDVLNTSIHDGLSNTPDSKSKWKVLLKITISYPRLLFLVLLLILKNYNINPETVFPMCSWWIIYHYSKKSHNNDHGPDNIKKDNKIQSTRPYTHQLSYRQLFLAKLSIPVFPAWKIVLVRYLNKTSNHSSLHKFRPISNLHVFRPFFKNCIYIVSIFKNNSYFIFLIIII